MKTSAVHFSDDGYSDKVFVDRLRTALHNGQKCLLVSYGASHVLDGLCDHRGWGLEGYKTLSRTNINREEDVAYLIV